MDPMEKPLGRLEKSRKDRIFIRADVFISTKPRVITLVCSVLRLRRFKNFLILTRMPFRLEPEMIEPRHNPFWHARQANPFGVEPRMPSVPSGCAPKARHRTAQDGAKRNPGS